jgi:hypothetical protein
VSVQALRQVRGRHRRDRRGVAEHEPDPLIRHHRIDRQIRRPGLEHRHNRCDRFG